MSSASGSPAANSMETELLLQQLAGGNEAALDQILESHRGYLRRLLEFRMDDELHGRIDPSDVIQETQLVASRRIDEFLQKRPISFKLWLRAKALEQLVHLQRKHVYATKRSVRREIPMSEASSLVLAQSLLAQRPSEVVQHRELAEQTNRAISQLGESDREVLQLRHVEDFTNAEIAELLEISPEAASKRYGRAVLRLRAKLVKAGAPSEL